MAYEFKKLSDVNVVENMSDGTNVLIEENGEIVKIAANSMIPEDVALKSDIPTGIVKSVNGEVPDEAGNVIVSGLPDGSAAHQQLVTDGEGNAKWEDRLVWKYEQPVDYLSGEVSLTFADGQPSTISTANTFVTSQEYTVSWDGVEYNCIAYVAEGPNTPSIGNGSIASVLGGNDEPFFITIYEGELMIFAQEDGAHTVRIIGIEKDVHNIDPELLPEGYPYTEIKDVAIVYPEETIASEYTNGDIQAKSFDHANVLTNGGKYKVVFNGTEYICTAYETIDDGQEGTVVVVGNEAIMSGNGSNGTRQNTGEPFVYCEWPSDYVNIYWNGEPTCTIKIIEVEEVIHPMDSKYLPESVGGGLLNVAMTIYPEVRDDDTGRVRGSCNATFDQIVAAMRNGTIGSVTAFLWNSETDVPRFMPVGLVYETYSNTEGEEHHRFAIAVDIEFTGWYHLWYYDDNAFDAMFSD